jgi:hypothetical protein
MTEETALVAVFDEILKTPNVTLDVTRYDTPNDLLANPIDLGSPVTLVVLPSPPPSPLSSLLPSTPLEQTILEQVNTPVTTTTPTSAEPTTKKSYWGYIVLAVGLALALVLMLKK